MNITIPFNKEILFKSKIAEITSISLEHDVSINEKELLGDFIVSGDYKNLDVNVDTNPFSHIVPFSVELDNDIDLETLKYEIEDFSYEIKDEDILLVNILFHVSADKIINRHEELFEKPTENIFEEKNKESFDEKLYEDENKTTKEVASGKTTNDDFSSESIEEINFDNVRNTDIEKSVEIIKNNNLLDDYITYHIHMVKAGETFKTISKLYNISEEELFDLNSQSEISVGDKILIPELNEEE